MNRQKDSVINYLTPTKLISSSIKSKYRTNMSDIHNKTAQSQNKTLLQNVNNSTVRNKQQHLNILSKEVISEKQKSVQYSVKNRSQWDNKHFQNNVVREESEYNQRKEIIHPRQISDKVKFEEDNRINRQYFQSKVSDKKSVLRQGQPIQSRQNSHLNQSMNNYPTSPARSEVNQSNSLASQLFNLIRRLKSLKQTLDFQLGELHFILNNTTKYLQNIDDEFSKIKQRIINYTSRCIDSAFNDYKIKMNWKRFDDVVKKGTQYKGELEVIIKEEEIEIQKISLSHDLNQYKVKNKGQQLGKTIVFFDNLNREIEVLKEECIQMKPILKRQSIRAYQQALTAMVTF